MSSDVTWGSIGAAPERIGRVLGRVEGARPGPMLIAMAGLHGNESAGVLAALRVTEGLERRREFLSGDIVALAGNPRALNLNRRFIHRDLNRLWTPDRVRELKLTAPRTGAASPSLDSEEEEQWELLRALEEALAASRGPAFFLDLHSTSGPAPPFSTIVDSASSRTFALGIPVPLIMGLGDSVAGTLAAYMSGLGVPSVVFEGGQRGSRASMANCEAALWLSMTAARMIPDSGFHEVAQSWEHLREATRGLPPVLEIRYRHPVRKADRFQMNPGFESFQVVSSGQVLAEDRSGQIFSPEDGRLLMPLYQDQGEDGFFLIREVAS